MSIVDVFSRNLTALMKSRKELDSQVKLGAVAGLGSTNVGRFRRGDVAAQIDSVEKVAKAFELRACDILDPSLIKRLEAKEPLRMDEPKPPVMTEEDWRSMSPRARALVEDLCERSLAGTLSDEDIKWLHDSLERTKPKIRPPLSSAESADFHPLVPKLTDKTKALPRD